MNNAAQDREMAVKFSEPGILCAALRLRQAELVFAESSCEDKWKRSEFDLHFLERMAKLVGTKQPGIAAGVG